MSVVAIQSSAKDLLGFVMFRASDALGVAGEQTCLFMITPQRPELNSDPSVQLLQRNKSTEFVANVTKEAAATAFDVTFPEGWAFSARLQEFGTSTWSCVREGHAPHTGILDVVKKNG